MEVETIDTFDNESLRIGDQTFCGMFNDCQRFKVECIEIFYHIRINGKLMAFKNKLRGKEVLLFEAMRAILKI